MSALFAALLSTTGPVLAAATWPRGEPADALLASLAQTDAVEIGPRDCSPASGVIAARLLGIRFDSAAVVAVDELRRVARWPQDDIGMPLRRVADALERRGGVVAQLKEPRLATLAAGVNRGGVAIICGRDGQDRLHAVALSDYSPVDNTWIVQDPDLDQPLVVSNQDVRRFRHEGCADGIDLLVQAPHSRRFKQGKRKKKAAAAPRPAKAAPAGAKRERSAVVEPPAPRGGLGMGLGLLAGLIVVLGAAAVGARRGWFDEVEEPPPGGELPGDDDDTAEA